MLNYIIPPIIIVVSLAVLIFFLNKKVPKIQEELAEDQERKLAGESNNESKKASRIASFSLHFLEKFGRRSKVFFLKLHNISENATKKIKEKKDRRMQVEEEKKIFQEEPTDNNNSNNISAVNPRMQKRTSRAKRAFYEVKENEIPAKPMISQKVVLPESAVDSKVQYEKILIERIAANPRDIEAYERLGDYYSEQENGKDSLECYKQVLKLSPINRKAKMHIKRLERVLKNDSQE
jgi:tetratricopeptide (TPR) repeat protein